MKSFCRATVFNSLVVLILALAISFSISFTYWGTVVVEKDLPIPIGDFEFSNVGGGGDGGDGGLFDRLPPNTPPEVIQILKDKLSSGYSQEVLEALIDGIVLIVNTPELVESKNILFAENIEGFFDGSYELPLASGSLLIYTTAGEDGLNFSMVHLSPQFEGVYNIYTAQDFYTALSLDWTGVHQISNTWLSSVVYSRLNSPLYYGGSEWYLHYTGPRGTPPPQERNMWFEIEPDYNYSSQNQYYKDHIVFMHNRYYHAVQNPGSWAVPSASPAAWEPWQIVLRYESGQQFGRGSYVYTKDEGGKPRFWIALSATFDEPNEQNARLGLWREVSNGWIGEGDIVRSYYFEHNSYESDDIIIFGISPKLWYRYFRAKQNVPADTPPVIADEQGVAVINDEYWESMYFPF